MFGMVPLSVQADGATRVVHPSGDTSGVEDAANIQAVFDAIDGGTVRLAKGEFYLADSILVSGFQGMLKGSGSGMTVIHIMAALSPAFSFAAGDDMSLRVEKLAFEADCAGATAIEVTGDGGPTSGFLAIRQCEFSNVEIGVVTYEHISSVIRITHNDFQNVGEAILLAGPYESCDISVSHNRIDVARHGVEIYDVDETDILIFHNQMKGIYDSEATYQTGAAIMVGQFTQFGGSGSVRILCNEIQGYTNWFWGYDMVNVIDFGAFEEVPIPGNLRSVIAFNTIELAENNMWGGIGVHGGFSDTLIAFNEVSGTGDAGIYVAFWSQWGMETQTGVRVILNDVSNFNAVAVPGLIDPVAPIWIGPGVYDSLIVAMGDPSTVLDVSGGNTVIFLGA
jgi:hypothetical protein